MTTLILGLVILLGTHSVRIVADDWRTAQIASKGEKTWKALYAIISIGGLALVVWGYGQTRVDPIDLWNPPQWTHHVTALLTVLAFIGFAAAYVPGNHIKASLGHPMVAGVKTWAVAHLLSNGRLADVVLFGAFLVWSVVTFSASRRRDRAAGTTYPAGTLKGDVITVVAGVIAAVIFSKFLHLWLIGVAPS
jgi:uncharacterized membrane protein